MKNALSLLIVLNVSLFLTQSCRQSSTTTSVLETETVKLESDGGWILVVQANGGGSLRCQLLPQSTVQWPAETFDFTSIKQLPPFKPQTRVSYAFWWTYENVYTGEKRQYGLPDTVWAARWFDQAYLALMTWEEVPQIRRRLCKQWRTQPPPGVKRR